MAKKNNKANAIGLSVLALILGVIIGAGGNFGVTTATYNEDTNKEINKEITKPSKANSGQVYDNLQIHFLELGNKYAGDCTYIKAGDIDILIDAGSRADSVTTIKNYVDQYCTDGKLEYVIATHGHQDHIAAFVGNSSKTIEGGRDGLLYQYKIDNLIYFAKTAKETTLIKNFYKAVDFLTTKGTNCIKADAAYNNDHTYTLSSDITMDILYNKFYFEASTDENNHSVISMINYKDHHFLFTGDLEKEGEIEFSKFYDKSTSAKTLPGKIDLYKGGHHGSKTSSNDALLDLVDPQMCAVCCCAGSTEYTKNRVNTFPTQAFIDRIAKHTDAVYITSMWNEEKDMFESMNGNITVSSNGNDVGLAASNNLLKLKETAWFSHTVYVNDADQIVAKGTSGAKEVPCRTMPKEWQ